MFTYNLTTDTGKMRLLIPDNQPDTHTFEDDELATLLSLEGSNLKRGCALALETIASNEVYVLKYITLLDLSTNGPAVSSELRKRAADLRSQAMFDESREDGGAFDIAEMVDTSFQQRERLNKQWLRGSSGQ